MSSHSVQGINDVIVTGFDISIVQPNGELLKIPNGVTDLLKGDLSITTKDGSPDSRSEILTKVNMDSVSSVLVPDFIASENSARLQEKSTDSIAQEQAQITEAGEALKDINQEKISDLKKQLEALKEVRKDLEAFKYKPNKEEPAEKKQKDGALEALEAQVSQGLTEELLAQRNNESQTMMANKSKLPSAMPPTYTGNIAGGSTVSISTYCNGSLSGVSSTKVTNPNELLESTFDDLPEGEFTWIVTATDVAGNQNVLDNANQQIPIDTTYTDTHAQPDDASNTGSIDNNVTKSQNVVLSGKGELGSSINIKSLIGPSGQKIDVSSVVSVTSDKDGHWCISLPTLALGDGEYKWQIGLEDVAGNKTTVNGSTVLDTVTEITGKLESDTGVSSFDGVTSDKAPTFSGTGEICGMVELVIIGPDSQNIPNIPSTVVGADGSWKITIPDLPKDGIYTWHAKITDAAGNESSSCIQEFNLHHQHWTL